MEAQKNMLEPLFERAEAYGKTSFELLRLKTVDKTSALAASLISRLLFIAVVLIFAITINIALALWLGDYLGKTYYGFFVIAGVYALTGIILLLCHSFIRARAYNSFIKHLLN